MTGSTVRGRAWRLGTDVDTDVILPGQYMNKPPEEYSKHALEPVLPDFADRVEEGDVVVAETNFGIGSSREHAAVALKLAGVGAVVAVSFGRIFYRNAINQGLPALVCEPTVPESIDDGDELEVDVFGGSIRDLTTGETHPVQEVTEPQKSILEAGGAVEYYTG